MNITSHTRTTEAGNSITVVSNRTPEPFDFITARRVDHRTLGETLVLSFAHHDGDTGQSVVIHLSDAQMEQVAQAIADFHLSEEDD